MNGFLKDIRYGIRSLMRRPTLTVVAIILTLIWLVLAQGWIVIPGIN